MRAGYLIFFAILLLAACQYNNRIPGNVLPRAKMQAVILDLIRADEFLNDFMLPKDSTLDRKEESLKLYQQVFRIHQVSSEEFKESFSFYRSHPALLKVVLDSISKHKPVPVEINKLRTVKDTLGRFNKLRRLKVE